MNDYLKINKNIFVKPHIYSFYSKGHNYFDVQQSKDNLKLSDVYPMYATLILGLWFIYLGIFRYKKQTASNNG
jgi:hypothetical protein